MYKKDYTWNPAPCSCENGKYLGSIISDSVIMCDGNIHAVSRNLMSIMSTNVASANAISDHITVSNCSYLLSLHKTQI